MTTFVDVIYFPRKEDKRSAYILELHWMIKILCYKKQGF